MMTRTSAYAIVKDLMEHEDRSTVIGDLVSIGEYIANHPDSDSAVITIEVKSVYGNELYYPQNYQKELYTLTGCKTLTQAHIHALNGLGIKFNVIQHRKLTIA